MKDFSQQKGFLALIALVIVVVVAFINVIATYQFTHNTVAANNQLSSNQAYYLALAGLESAKHNIVTNGNSCIAINGSTNFTNSLLPGANGKFTVTGTPNIAVSTLSNIINDSTSVIPLASTEGFFNSGTGFINAELINYTGISSNTLTGAMRGINGTIAMNHANGTSVTQIQCLLASTGTVNNAKRNLQEILFGRNFAIKTNSGIINATINSADTVTLGGSSKVINPSVTASDPNFAGSNVISSGSVVMTGSANTKVNSNSGLVTSSTSTTYQADIMQNASMINSSNLFNQFFNASKATIEAEADKSYSSANINGASGKTIWMNSSLIISSNTTIGTPTAPVILIVNGPVTIVHGNVVLYGFLYATSEISVTGSSSFIGAIASESNIKISGSADIIYDTAILARLSQMNSHIKTTYQAAPNTLQEIFP